MSVPRGSVAGRGKGEEIERAEEADVRDRLADERDKLTERRPLGSA
jgi:hypothetical protein